MKETGDSLKLLTELSNQFGLTLCKNGDRYILHLQNEWYLCLDTVSGFLRLFRKSDRYYISQNISPLVGVMVLCPPDFSDFNVLFSEPDMFSHGSGMKDHLLFGGMYTLYEDLYFSEELGSFFGYDTTTSLMVFDLRKGYFGFSDIYDIKEQLEEIVTQTGYKLVTLKKVNSWVKSLDGGSV